MTDLKLDKIYNVLSKPPITKEIEELIYCDLKYFNIYDNIKRISEYKDTDSMYDKVIYIYRWLANYVLRTNNSYSIFFISLFNEEEGLKHLKNIDTTNLENIFEYDMPDSHIDYINSITVNGYIQNGKHWMSKYIKPNSIYKKTYNDFEIRIKFSNLVPGIQIQNKHLFEFKNVVGHESSYYYFGSKPNLEKIKNKLNKLTLEVDTKCFELNYKSELEDFNLRKSRVKSTMFNVPIIYPVIDGLLKVVENSIEEFIPNVVDIEIDYDEFNLYSSKLINVSAYVNNRVVQLYPQYQRGLNETHLEIVREIELLIDNEIEELTLYLDSLGINYILNYDNMGYYIIINVTHNNKKYNLSSRANTIKDIYPIYTPTLESQYKWINNYHLLLN